MNRTIAWFRSLSLRERWLVSLAGALLGLIVGYYGIVMPVMDGVNDARRDRAEAVEREGRILAKIEQLNGPAVEQDNPVSGPLDPFIRQETSEMGLSVEDIRASGDDAVTFSFSQVTATALFGWLASLERRGLVVTDVDARPAAGSALSARISLRRP